MENITKENEMSLDLNDIINIILRHKFVIIFITSLMIAIAFLYVKTRDDIYYASSIILLEDQNKNLEINALKDKNTIDSLYIASQIQVLKSKDLISNTLNRMGIFDSPNILIPDIKKETPVNNDDLINYVLKNLTVKQVQKSKAIEIGYSSKNKELAAWLTNTLVKLYIKTQISSDKIDISSTNKWLKDRVTELRNQVNNIDRDIIEYRKKYNFIDDDKQNLLKNKINKLNENLVKAQIDLARTKAKWEEINSENALDSAPDIIKSPIIQKLIERKAITIDEIARIENEYGKDHPAMISANNRLYAITGQIEQEINKIASSIEREYNIAKTNLEEIKSQIDNLTNQYNEMSEHNIKLASLERESKSRKKLLEKLDARWKEIQVQEEGAQIQEASAVILSKATTPNTPKGASPKVIILISVIGGLCLSIAIAITLDYMQTTIYNGKQLEKITNLPNIALVPWLNKYKKPQIAQSVNELYKAPLSDYSESLRSITTHLRRNIKNFPAQKIFNFTSIARGDGKSALVAASACQLSIEGLKVLVIDCDLRNPSISKAFNLQDKKGLSDLLKGDVKLKDVIYKDKKSSVDLIGIGSIKDINIIGKQSKTWKQILTRISQDYDVILLDGPCVINISDMNILAQDSQNIICVRWKKTSLKKIIYSQSLLKNLNFALLGTVITLVSPKKIKQLNKA